MSRRAEPRSGGSRRLGRCKADSRHDATGRLKRMHQMDEWQGAKGESGADRALQIALLGPLVFLTLVQVSAASPAPSIRAAEAARIELIKRLSPSVASLYTKDNHIGGGS